ncbi:serine/threonine-protein kinase [Nonomuraea turcica]|uniref:serine/threonine-protein kinase n=1 Tax=Nonomuraea sp. G32 TaxID=3067274 RepID=UPI00273AD58E|nr:WD40 repeat domain-containing serine/threonine-protein kinase [Nonomuraea sp. G32]MDP4506526.1 WD40 repeat domain-containing serine/threonine-protein kinase [Nonomuraea sp. G32]
MVPLTSSDPHRLGRYWLVGRLGAGGQGVVYEAYGEPGERVAIKVPRSEGAEARARLAKEASAAERVASFCTAKVIEAQVEAAPLYIVSEYVPGLSLRQVVAESGSYEGDRLRRLAVGVATALTAIHQAGIVHRDLKPDNIILGPDGPRVIDFGVAREVGPTTSGPIMGTPNYMSPEVFDGRAVTEAADLWAWGLVVLFAARGRDAIEHGDPMAVIGRLLGFKPDVAGLPEPLGSLVAAALSRNAADRPTAKEVLLRLLDDTVAGDAAEEDPLARGGTLAGTLKGRAEPDLGAIAEELYAELTETERASVPEVFLRMIDGDALRPVDRDELPEPPAVDALLDVFAAAGIVTRTGTAYALAMPGLLRAWPRLGEWVAGNSAGLPVHRRLVDAAAEWESHGRRPGDLMHGSALDRTLHWAAAERKDLTLARREREYLDAASRQARRQSRRRNLVAAALAVLLVAALGGFGSAEYLRRESNRQRDNALAQALALRAADLRKSDPQAAMLLSVAGWRLSPGLPEARGALYDSLSQSTTSVFADPDYTADTVQALGQDGRTLVSVSDGTARIWDLPGKRRIGTLSGVGTGVAQAALAPDGRTLALLDGKAARLWDTRTGRPLGGPIPLGKGHKWGADLEFDKSGRYLAIPGQVLQEWWDVTTRKRLTAPSGAAVKAISGDGRHGFVADDTREELWDLRSDKKTRIPRFPDGAVIDDIAFSDDGRALVTLETLASGEQSRLRLFELPTAGETMGEESDRATNVAFAFGDAFIATWGGGSMLRLQRRSGFATVYERAMPDFVAQLGFDLAGRAVRYLNDRGVVYTEDVSMAFDRPIAAGDGASVALDPSARVLTEVNMDTIDVWDTATGRPLIAPVGWSGTGAATAFDAGGRRLALAGGDKVSIVDLAGREVSARLKLTGNGRKGARALAFSPDGRTLAVSREDESGRVELWDLERGTARTTSGRSAGYLAFRPDGRLLMTGDPFQLIDPATGATRPLAPGTGQLDGPFSVSPDGRQVVFAGPDRLTLWDGDVRARIAQFSAVPGSEATMLAWSPDGRTIASYEKGMRVRLWDVPTRQPLGIVFDGKQRLDEVGDGWVAFSADGTKLHTAALDGTVRVHDVDERHVAATVCARAGRTLTAAEWSRHLPGVEPFTLCRSAESAARGSTSGSERRSGR